MGASVDGVGCLKCSQNVTKNTCYERAPQTNAKNRRSGCSFKTNIFMQD